MSLNASLWSALKKSEKASWREDSKAKSWIRRSTNKLRRILKKLENLSKVFWNLLNWPRIESRSLISPTRTKVIFLSFLLTTRRHFLGFMRSYSLIELDLIKAKVLVNPWSLIMVVVFTEIMPLEHSAVVTLEVSLTPALLTDSFNPKMHIFWIVLDKTMLTTIRQCLIMVDSSQITISNSNLIKKIKIMENTCPT